MANKREETPDILGDVLGSEEGGGNATEIATGGDEVDEGQEREEVSGSTRGEGDTDRTSSSGGEAKRKATYYLREETLSELEEVWFRLRQRADEGEKRRVSKSAIVEAALLDAIDDFNDGGNSTIAQRLLG